MTIPPEDHWDDLWPEVEEDDLPEDEYPTASEEDE